MHVCYFLTFEHADADARLDTAAQAAVIERVRAIPGLAHAVVHTPTNTSDPYLGNEFGPLLALQLYFHELGDLEAAASANGPLQALDDATRFPLLAASSKKQQALATRRFLGEPASASTPARCTYLVAYEGASSEPQRWLSHYLSHHIPLMRTFPGIRQVEVYTPLEWLSDNSWTRTTAMQRNKVVFDDPAGLTGALNSPVRHAMREDFHNFPPFDGANTHYPMMSVTVMGTAT